MKHIFTATLCSTMLSVLLASCTIGQSAPAPNNVQAVAGDSSITVTWDMVPGVDYLLYMAPMAGVSPQNCSSNPACLSVMKATSPLVIPTANIGMTNAAFTSNGTVSALTNGTLFSISIDGRTNGGPGGPGSTAVSATPRLAGSSWAAGSSPAANDLRGITSGTATVAGVVSSIYVAVGTNGGLYSSLPGKAWTTLTNPLPTATLNAVTSYSTNFVAVGTGGEVLLSADAITWTQQTSNTIKNLNAIASNGANGYVAVGDNGTIITSTGGSTWQVQNSGTTNHLYGITYASNGLYVAVGAAGTLLTSSDTITWTAKAPATAADLKGVAYGGYTVSAGIGSVTPNTFAVIGTAGTLVTSIDGGITWVVQPAISGINLNAITYGHQFIAVGAGGNIYTSTDGLNWQTQTSGTAIDLLAIAHGRFDYLTTGMTGINLYSK